MSKVCILSWHFNTPEITLEYFIKQSPGRSGKWKDMEAVTDPFSADFVFVMDGYNHPLPQDRVIYFGAHPFVPGFSKSFRTFEDKKCLAKVRLDKHLNMGEWWCEYDYDTLANLKCPEKDRQLVCIMTYQTHNLMYAQRVNFMHSFVRDQMENITKCEGLFDLYGRPEEKFRQDGILSHAYRGPLGQNNPDGYLNQHTQGKIPALLPYEYSLEFDVGPTQNYLSERFYDSLLLWCKPIYYGSSNARDFIPQDAFGMIDIDTTENAAGRVFQEMDTLGWFESYKAISAARDLLLNKYNIWPYMHNVIHNLEKFQ